MNLGFEEIAGQRGGGIYLLFAIVNMRITCYEAEFCQNLFLSVSSLALLCARDQATKTII